MAEPKPDYIEENRIIFMNGEFNERKAELIIARMFQYECMDPSKDILLIIDSYGGFVDSFIAIHDAMKLLRCDVATICVGKAMSCGQMLLVSGTKGKRFITPHSRVLVHQISSFSGGSLKDMEIDITESKRLQKEVFEKLILKYTKIKAGQLKAMMEKGDNFFDAKKSLELGLVDKIVNTPKDLYGILNI